MLFGIRKNVGQCVFGLEVLLDKGINLFGWGNDSRDFQLQHIS